MNKTAIVNKFMWFVGALLALAMIFVVVQTGDFVIKFIVLAVTFIIGWRLVFLLIDRLIGPGGPRQPKMSRKNADVARQNARLYRTVQDKATLEGDRRLPK